ncbi:hypothetical protein DWU98_01250 [Dyella monticola]|uniref:Secreted protein n=2 Tax=Dyella monticola TaxID=1927958 RepID=A0A370X8I8_9GAMM|nr:hypothetical protein DWU98_01250 [Dyella monticola]
MRTKLLVPTLLSVLLSGALASSAMGQGTGPVAFDVTESALAWSAACNGGPDSPPLLVDPSITDVSGSNGNQGSNLSANACGFPLYALSSADSTTNASDTVELDDAGGSSTWEGLYLLGGILTADSKTETDACAASSAQTVNCSDTATFTNVSFAGRYITGDFTSKQTFYASDFAVSLSGYCDGLADFTGSLTVGDTSLQNHGNSEAITFSPLSVSGTLTCIGLPLKTMNVQLKDYDDWTFDVPVKEVYRTLNVSLE